MNKIIRNKLKIVSVKKSKNFRKLLITYFCERFIFAYSHVHEDFMKVSWIYREDKNSLSVKNLIPKKGKN